MTRSMQFEGATVTDAMIDRGRQFDNLAEKTRKNRKRNNYSRNWENSGYDCEITADSRTIDIREYRVGCDIHIKPLPMIIATIASGW